MANIFFLTITIIALYFQDNDQEAPESLLYSQNVNEVADNNDEASTTSTPISTNNRAHPYSRPNNSKRNISTNLSNEVLLSVREHFKKPQEVEDRYDHFGKTVAMRVRSLEKRQRLIAEKMINDILFEAEMGSLTMPLRHFIDNQPWSSYSNSSGSPSPTSTYINIPSASPSSLSRFEAVSHSGEHPSPQGAQLSDSLEVQFSQNTAGSFLSAFTEHNYAQ